MAEDGSEKDQDTASRNKAILGNADSPVFKKKLKKRKRVIFDSDDDEDIDNENNKTVENKEEGNNGVEADVRENVEREMGAGVSGELMEEDMKTQNDSKEMVRNDLVKEKKKKIEDGQMKVINGMPFCVYINS